MSERFETTKHKTIPPYPAAPYGYCNEDDVINLSQILEVLAEQKRVIAGIVTVCLIAAATYVLTATPLYRATMTLRPGSIAQNAQWKVEDIKKWFDEEHYILIFPRELLAPKESVPRIKTVLTRGSNSVTAELLYPDRDKGTAILNALYENFEKTYAGEGRDLGIMAEKMALQNQIDDMIFQLETIDGVQLAKINLDILQKMQSAEILQKSGSPASATRT